MILAYNLAPGAIEMINPCSKELGVPAAGQDGWLIKIKGSLN
jgi:hypothetical protein